MRVGNTVEHQQQSRFTQIFQHVFQMHMIFRSINKAHHTLMARAFADGIEPLSGNKMHAHVFDGSFLQHFAGTCVALAFLDIKLGDAFRVLPQSGVNGMKAVNQSLVCHLLTFKKIAAIIAA